MISFLRLFVIFATISFVFCQQEWEKVKVKINQGELEGLKLETESNKSYYAFRTIPYAKPPLGELRFKRPMPADKWEGTRDATGDSGGCPQYIAALGINMGSEDCLFVNVHTPGLNTSHLKEVLFFVHGGIYNLGSSSTLFAGPGKIMDYDVVLVTFNYRLGALGFLSTDDEVASGNFGLWDQVEALKWVHENIRNFGGNPNKITVFGYGVSLLLLQPSVKGLFHRMISHSLAPECSLSIQDNPKKVAEDLAKAVGCNITSTNLSSEVVDCLRTKEADQLIEATKELSADTIYPVLFAPIVDSNISKVPFFRDHPSKLMSKGEFTKVPVITGFVRNEGSWYYLKIKALHGDILNKTFLIEKFPEILMNTTRFRSNLTELSNRTLDLYFGNVDWSNSSTVQETLVNILSDASVRSCHKKFVDQLMKFDVPTYTYIFEYNGSFSLTQLMFRGERAGVAHGDETQYIFEMPLVRLLPFTSSDNITSQRLLHLWTNFAKRGVPNNSTMDQALLPVKWLPTERNSPRFLHFGNDLWTDPGYDSRYVDFWNEIGTQLDVKDRMSSQYKTYTSLANC